jgi:HAD superfamily hydrolase (TIGR01490 family)
VSASAQSQPRSGAAAIAAIDVDGTLFSGRASQHVFLRILRSSDLLPRGMFARLLAVYVLHRLRLIDSVGARLRGLAVLDGLPLAQAELLGERLAAELLLVVRDDARAEIASLRARGLRVMLVSASLDLVVRHLAERLGTDGYLASELLIVDGRCRAAFAGPVLEGQQKWLALRRYADAHFGRDGWTLAIAYGDSPDDVALLERAEQPVAVNAQRKLACTAARRDWRRISWR